MKILLIDNYDSFTFNLVHYLKGFDAEVTVVLNDQLNEVNLNEFDKVVLSPGPGLPKTSGDLMSFLSKAIGNKPIMGVCLGMQAIVEMFGGELFNQEEVKQGVAETCYLPLKSFFFEGIPNSFQVGLYHSWAVKETALPIELQCIAKMKSGIVMGIQHTKLPIVGVQFHPESVLTEYGKQIIQNFLNNIN